MFGIHLVAFQVETEKFVRESGSFVYKINIK